MSFCFHEVNYQLWNANEISSALEKFLHFFYISRYMYVTTWDAYIILFYTLTVLVLLILANVLYVGYAHENRLHYAWNLVFLRVFFLLFEWVLYLPMTELFVSVMNCTDGKHSFFSDQDCWTGTHVVHSMVAVIITGVFTWLVCVL